MYNKKYILLTIVLLTIIVSGCSKKENNENVSPIESNTNIGVIENKQLEVFTFTNTSLIWDGNSSDLETLITNTSDNDEYLKGFTVHVYDNDGNEIALMEGYVGTIIKAHQKRVMSTGHYENLTDAAKVEYEIIR